MPISAQYDPEMHRRFLGTLDLDLAEQLFAPLKANPFFVKDRNLHYVAANLAMARLCGLESPAELIGRTAQEIFPRDHADRYEAMDWRVLAGGASNQRRTRPHCLRGR